MANVIAKNIRKHYYKSLAEGQEYYRKYFVRTHLYASYKTEVDALLISWGLGACIVDS